MTDQTDIEVHPASCTTGTGFLLQVNRPERCDNHPSLSSISCEYFGATHHPLPSVHTYASHGVNTGIILGNCAFVGHGALTDRGAPSRVSSFYFAARIETEELESYFFLV